MNNEPKCWGMLDKDGKIYDVISPEEHARAEGSYTVPLYTAPKELTDEEIQKIALAELGTEHDWQNIAFARVILKKAREK